MQRLCRSDSNAPKLWSRHGNGSALHINTVFTLAHFSGPVPEQPCWPSFTLFAVNRGWLDSKVQKCNKGE